MFQECQNYNDVEKLIVIKSIMYRFQYIYILNNNLYKSPNLINFFQFIVQQINDINYISVLVKNFFITINIILVDYFLRQLNLNQIKIFGFMLSKIKR